MTSGQEQVTACRGWGGISTFHVGRWLCTDLSIARSSCSPCRRIILALIQISCGHPGIHLNCVQKLYVFTEMYFYVCLFSHFQSLVLFLALCSGPGYLWGEQGSHLEMRKAPKAKFVSVEIFSFDIFRRAL